MALSALVLTSCEQYTISTGTTSATTQVATPAPVYEFGFNLNDYNINKDTLRQGDTFGKLLEEKGVAVGDIYSITTQTKELISPKNFHVGKMYAFLYDKKKPDTPHSFVYQPNVVDYIVVHLIDSIYAYTAQRKVSVVEKAFAGSIENNLTVDAQAAGISQNATYQLGQIFDYTIDFFRLQKGDVFKIIYDERYVEDTIFAGVEKVKAAYFEWEGKKYYAFNYTT